MRQRQSGSCQFANIICFYLRFLGFAFYQNMKYIFCTFLFGYRKISIFLFSCQMKVGHAGCICSSFSNHYRVFFFHLWMLHFLNLVLLCGEDFRCAITRKIDFHSSFLHQHAYISQVNIKSSQDLLHHLSLPRVIQYLQQMLYLTS